MWKRFFKYFRNADTVYQVHSPFLFDFCNEVIDKKPYSNQPDIQILTQPLHSYRDSIQDTIMDAQTIPTSLTSKVYNFISHSWFHRIVVSYLLNMVNYHQPKRFLEMGNTLGFTRDRLALASPHTQFTTINSPLIAKTSDQQDIEFPKHLMIDSLTTSVPSTDLYDMVFVAAQSQSRFMIQNLNLIKSQLAPHSILIFNGIHLTKEMEKSWEEIKKDNCVSYSVDLFQIGIIFTHSLNREPEHKILIPWKFKPWKLKLK